MSVSDPYSSEATASSAPAEAAIYPPDALVCVMAGVVFVTTGQVACDTLGVAPTQVALTPLVARRIALVLRSCLGAATREEREVSVAHWQAEEDARMPRGRVLIDDVAAHVGIEPLGAGSYVSVRWEHAAAMVLALEASSS